MITRTEVALHYHINIKHNNKKKQIEETFEKRRKKTYRNSYATFSIEHLKPTMVKEFTLVESTKKK